MRETIRSYEAVREISANYNSEADLKMLDDGTPIRLEDIPVLISELEKRMKDLAKSMEFEKAAEVRDEIQALRKMGGLGDARQVGREKRKLPGYNRRS